jgi:signal-transduction protein with cAMP-binding, CBS, and nucleotidyltransferase domain
MTEYAEVEIVRHFDPVMLPPDATVMMAARHMHSRHVDAVLVTEEDDKLVGIFTERDAISRVLAEGKDPVATTLADVMTDNPNTVAPEDSTTKIVRLMKAAHCRHLPIVEGRKVVGMVSRGQLTVEPNPVSADEPACSSAFREKTMPDPTWVGFTSPATSPDP